MNIEELNQILNKLIELGEDKDEMGYWRDIFPNLDEAHQKEIMDLFKFELKKLEEAEKQGSIENKA